MHLLWSKGSVQLVDVALGQYVACAPAAGSSARPSTISVTYDAMMTRSSSAIDDAAQMQCAAVWPPNWFATTARRSASRRTSASSTSQAISPSEHTHSYLRIARVLVEQLALRTKTTPLRARHVAVPEVARRGRPAGRYTVRCAPQPQRYPTVPALPGMTLVPPLYPAGRRRLGSLPAQAASRRSRRVCRRSSTSTTTWADTVMCRRHGSSHQDRQDPASKARDHAADV